MGSAAYQEIVVVSTKWKHITKLLTTRQLARAWAKHLSFKDSLENLGGTEQCVILLQPSTKEPVNEKLLYLRVLSMFGSLL